MLLNLTGDPVEILRRLRPDRTIRLMQTRNWHCFLEMLLCAFLLVEGRLNHWHYVNWSPCLYEICCARWMPAPGNTQTPSDLRRRGDGGHLFWTGVSWESSNHSRLRQWGVRAWTTDLTSPNRRRKCDWQNAAQPKDYLNALSQPKVSGGLQILVIVHCMSILKLIIFWPGMKDLVS